MKNIILLTYCSFLISCIKEKGGSYTSYFDNQFNSKIDIQPFKQGKLDITNKKEVQPNQKFEIYLSSGSEGLISYDIHIAGYDSIILAVANKKIIHYGYNSPGTNPKAIKYNDLKNIFNKNNWIESIKVNKKYESVREYTYTFTEQDYLDAKK